MSETGYISAGNIAGRYRVYNQRIPIAAQGHTCVLNCAVRLSPLAGYKISRVNANGGV